MFRAVQVEHKAKSLEEGRPIFTEKIYITKLPSNDNTLVIDREVRPSDKHEFAQEWARYEQKKVSIPSGTPIDAWMAISDTQKAEFKALHIYTVDQFAMAADSVGTRIMGFNELRRKAQAFVAASKDDQILRDNHVLQNRLAELEARMALMVDIKDEKIKGLPARKSAVKAPSRRGRPKRVTIESIMTEG